MNWDGQIWKSGNANQPCSFALPRHHASQGQVYSFHSFLTNLGFHFGAFSPSTSLSQVWSWNRGWGCPYFCSLSHLLFTGARSRVISFMFYFFFRMVVVITRCFPPLSWPLLCAGASPRPCSSFSRWWLSQEWAQADRLIWVDWVVNSFFFFFFSRLCFIRSYKILPDSEFNKVEWFYLHLYWYWYLPFHLLKYSLLLLAFSISSVNAHLYYFWITLGYKYDQAKITVKDHLRAQNYVG